MSITTQFADAPTVLAARRDARGPWPGMVAVVLTAIVTMTPVFAVSALATPVERELNVSATAFGLVLSGFFAVSAIGSWPAKRVLGRLRLPVVLAVAVGAAIVSLVVAATAGSVAGLCGSLVLAGAGNALVQPAAGQYIAAAIPARRVSLASGMASAALGAAPLLPGLLAGTVAQAFGWRTALAVPIALGLVALPLTGLVRVPRDTATGATAPSAAEAGGAVTASRSGTGSATQRVLVLWTVAAGLATIGSNAAASFFIQIGTHSGLSTGTAGLMQSLAGAMAIGVRLAVGLLADRAPRRNPAVVAVMMLSGAVGMSLIAVGTPVTFVGGALLTVAGGWGWTGLLLAAVMRLLPGQGARAGAVMQVGLFGGAALAPLAFGVLSSAFGIPATILVASVAALVAAGAVVAGSRVVGQRA